MVTRNLLTSILQEHNIDIDEVAAVDRWLDASLEQIDFNEEPSLVNWLSTDPEAIAAFRTTMAAIYTIYVLEAQKGTGALEVIKQFEQLISRLVAAYTHKGIIMGRKESLKPIPEATLS